MKELCSESQKIIECKKNGILNLAYLRNPNSTASLKKCIKNGANKTCKSVRRVSKTQSGNEFK